MTGRWFWLCSAVCFFMYDCGASSRFEQRKSDATKGTVTGTVTCTDTGKPARFATVTLVPAPGSPEGKGAPTEETAVTDLDGKFKIEAVTPGQYYAVSTLAGYLNPEYGVDFERMKADSNGDSEEKELVAQWKEHMVEAQVSAQQVTDVAIEMERGAEIRGTVAYDDGSPAIGVRFAVYRRNENGGWITVGQGGREFTLEETSDGRGRFAVSNLPGGEYAVCALVPADNQASSPQVCLGNVFRRRDAKPVSASAGETVIGADIEIPLKAIHEVSGSLAAAAGDQAPVQAELRLLYADDRETALTMRSFSDGSFVFPFVPEGSYILQVRGATYSEPAAGEAGSKAPVKTHLYADREIAVVVDKDVKDLAVVLVEAPPTKNAPQQ